MSARPLLLDLFCGAGGAATGYWRAGFDVVGVDNRPQPRYPFPFVQADALNPPFDLSGFDAIHASPPCQAHTAMKHMYNAKSHADLVPQTRALLKGSGRPYAIENVPGAPVQGIVLCGSMFNLGTDEAELRRHRLFETSWFFWNHPRCQHGAAATLGVYGGHVRNRQRTIGVYGKGARDSRRKSNRGVPDFTVDQGRVAMGVDWMTTTELSQAIPPAYTEFIGRAMLASLLARPRPPIAAATK